MDLKKLEEALKKSWCEETAYDSEEWTWENPSIGQCAVTALVVNDYLGGDIVWSEAVLPNGDTVSHYFNIIDGKEVDLTRNQFPPGIVIPRGKEKKKEYASTREFMLSNKNTRLRYGKLKVSVESNLRNNTGN